MVRAGLEDTEGLHGRQAKLLPPNKEDEVLIRVVHPHAYRTSLMRIFLIFTMKSSEYNKNHLKVHHNFLLPMEKTLNVLCWVSC